VNACRIVGCGESAVYQRSGLCGRHYYLLRKRRKARRDFAAEDIYEVQTVIVGVFHGAKGAWRWANVWRPSP
jgi:hypothetical protein